MYATLIAVTIVGVIYLVARNEPTPRSRRRRDHADGGSDVGDTSSAADGGADCGGDGGCD